MQASKIKNRVKENVDEEEVEGVEGVEGVEKVRQCKKDMESGLLLFSKPSGISSYDVVREVKKKLNIRKVGHCGTLDPFASGLLLICFGKATKLSKYLMELPKSYIGEIQFGEERDSHDLTGEVVNRSELKVEEKELLKVLKSFEGKTYQMPPQYSAIKVEGKRSYEYARKGIKVELKKRLINIYECKLIYFAKGENKAKIAVKCSKGTYIRTLAYDIGRALGSYGYLKWLRRDGIGDYILSAKNGLEMGSSKYDYMNNVVSLRESLNFLYSMRVPDAVKEKIRYGKALKGHIKVEEEFMGLICLKDGSGELLAVVDNELRYKDVFISI